MISVPYTKYIKNIRSTQVHRCTRMTHQRLSPHDKRFLSAVQTTRNQRCSSCSAVPHPRGVLATTSAASRCYPVCFSGVVAAGVIGCMAPHPYPPYYPLTHTPSHPYPGTMQTVSWKVAHAAVFWIGALQHEALPPGRFQQPRPPQLPHDLAQQMPPGPRMPWSHQVIGAAGG